MMKRKRKSLKCVELLLCAEKNAAFVTILALIFNCMIIIIIIITYNKRILFIRDLNGWNNYAHGI